ncbi:Suppressor of lurcher protein 1, partial [Orchesella cincta]
PQPAGKEVPRNEPIYWGIGVKMIIAAEMKTDTKTDKLPIYRDAECLFRIPQCNQVISSDGGRNGSFSTPNFPNPYPPKAHCRFEFIGHGRERVHIVFVDFDLFHSDKINFNIPETALKLAEDEEGEDLDGQDGNNGSNDKKDEIIDLDVSGRKNGGKKRRKGGIKDPEKVVKLLSKYAGADGKAASGISERKCAYADSIAAFIYVDGEERKLLRHCGTHPPPNLMSNGHRLTVEFRGKGNHNSPLYLGVSSGRQLANYPCAFIFNSSEMRNGSLSSPNYPGLYPRDTECHYFFHAMRAGDHVEIYFDHFEVVGISPCDEDWDDYVELSNHMPMEDSHFLRKCGREPLRPFSVRSDGQFFRLSFKSNDRYDGSGFHARFQFTDKINQIPVVNVNSAPAFFEASLLPFYFISFHEMS